MMQPGMGPNPGQMGRDGPLGPDGPHGPMRHDGMPDGPMRHGGPMGPPEWMERGGPMGPRDPGRGPMGFGPGPYMQGGPPNPGFGSQMGDPRMGLDMAPTMMQHGGMDPVMGGMHMGDNQGQQGRSSSILCRCHQILVAIIKATLCDNYLGFSRRLCTSA